MKTYGRWETVGQPVGRGGQGEVLKVRDTTGNIAEPCALKRLRKNATKQARARFRQEVEVAQAARHPNALRLYDSDPEAERPYTWRSTAMVVPFKKGVRRGLRLISDPHSKCSCLSSTPWWFSIKMGGSIAM